MSEANDYEQERLKNIKENEKLMKELGVLGGSATIGGPPKKATPIKAKKPSSTPRKKTDSTPKKILPTRSSARIAGHEADSEVLKRKYEEEAEEARKVAEAAKRARHGQFDLSGMTGGQLEEEAIRALEATLNGIATNIATAGELEDIKQETSSRRRHRNDSQPNGHASTSRSSKGSDCSDLEQILNKMTLKSAAKVTPKRIYTMAYHPSTDKDLVFVGDKEGSIGVWDASATASKENLKQEDDDADEEEEQEFASGQSWQLQVHGRSPVTCIKFDPVDHNSVYSSSYDSTLRKLDLASGKSDEVWVGEEDILLSIFDILSPCTHPSAYIDTPTPALDQRSIWIADHRGGLIHIDLREKSRRNNATNTRRWQVCEKKIGAMSVNPLSPHCVATASLDQHVRLFDVRALSTLVPETPEAPYNYKNVDPTNLELAQSKSQFAAHKARQACTSVDFSPAGNHLVGVSYDDVVKVWDLNPSWLYSAHSAKAVKNNLSPSKSKTTSTSTSRSGRKSSIKKEEDPEAADTKEGGLLKWFSRSHRPLKTENEVYEAIEQEKNKVLAEASSLSADDNKKKNRSNGSSNNGNGNGNGEMPEDVLANPNRIPHNNQTGKWLTLFRARWNQNPDLYPHFTIGSMTRRAEIYGADGTLLRTLWDENVVTAVPAVTALHPILPGRLVTGNASGRCTFWSPDLV